MYTRIKGYKSPVKLLKESNTLNFMDGKSPFVESFKA